MYSKRNRNVKPASMKPSYGWWIVVGLIVIGVICVSLCCSDQGQSSISEDDMQKVLGNFIEHEFSELAQGRITPEFAEAVAEAAQGAKGYDLEPCLLRMCQSDFRIDLVREFLNDAMFYLVKIPDDDERLSHFIMYSDFVLCRDITFSKIQGETNEGLAAVHKQSEIIVAGTDAIAKRMAKGDNSLGDVNFDKLEPCRAAMSRLAKTMFDFTHTAKMMIDYNENAAYKRDDELKAVRQAYLDSGIDEKAFPVDVRNRDEQLAFLRSIWQKLFEDRNAIWQEMGSSYKKHPDWEEELWVRSKSYDWDVKKQYRDNKPQVW